MHWEKSSILTQKIERSVLYVLLHFVYVFRTQMSLIHAKAQGFLF